MNQVVLGNDEEVAVAEPLVDLGVQDGRANLIVVDQALELFNVGGSRTKGRRMLDRIGEYPPPDRRIGEALDDRGLGALVQLLVFEVVLHALLLQLIR